MAEDGGLRMVTVSPVGADWHAVQCTQCRTAHLLPITVAEVKRWRDGAYLQDVKPEWSASRRELMISGICGMCFDLLFAEPD